CRPSVRGKRVPDRSYTATATGERRMQRAIGVGCAALAAALFAVTAAAAPQARLTRAELAELRTAGVGSVVTLSSVPLDATRIGAVRVKRIDVYAPGARVLVADKDGTREVPRSTWRHYVADPHDPESPLIAFSLAEDGTLGAGMLMTPEGTYALEGDVANGLALRVGARADRAPDGT